MKVEHRPSRRCLKQPAQPLHSLLSVLALHHFTSPPPSRLMFAPEQTDLLAYRDSVNWRSVTRADPSVQQIINTCTFSTVYIFDTGRDEWVKQKQEGPLFLVRRSVPAPSPTCKSAAWLIRVQE